MPTMFGIRESCAAVTVSHMPAQKFSTPKQPASNINETLYTECIHTKKYLYCAVTCRLIRNFSRNIIFFFFWFFFAHIHGMKRNETKTLIYTNEKCLCGTRKNYIGRICRQKRRNVTKMHNIPMTTSVA